MTVSNRVASLKIKKKKKQRDTGVGISNVERSHEPLKTVFDKLGRRGGQVDADTTLHVLELAQDTQQEVSRSLVLELLLEIVNAGANVVDDGGQLVLEIGEHSLAVTKMRQTRDVRMILDSRRDEKVKYEHFDLSLTRELSSLCKIGQEVDESVTAVQWRK
jgi:hypothetical protein